MGEARRLRQRGVYFLYWSVFAMLTFGRCGCSRRRSWLFATKYVCRCVNPIVTSVDRLYVGYITRQAECLSFRTAIKSLLCGCPDGRMVECVRLSHTRRTGNTERVSIYTLYPLSFLHTPSQSTLSEQQGRNAPGTTVVAELRIENGAGHRFLLSHV